MDSVKQFHAMARMVRAIDRKQQPLVRRNIFVPSAGWWKAKQSPLGLRKKPEGEKSGVVGISWPTIQPGRCRRVPRLAARSRRVPQTVLPG